MTSFQALERPDNWAAGNPSCTVRYQLIADAEPDLLCRVLNLLAMQYLIPLSLQVVRCDERLQLNLQLDGLSWHRAEVIGHKMRNLIDVHAVQLSQSLDTIGPH